MGITITPRYLAQFESFLLCFCLFHVSLALLALQAPWLQISSHCLACNGAKNYRPIILSPSSLAHRCIKCRRYVQPVNAVLWRASERARARFSSAIFSASSFPVMLRLIAPQRLLARVEMG